MKIYKIAILLVAVAGILLYTPGASASSPFDITFPIPELANCAEKDACRLYCDDLAHQDECVAFAKKH
ncbi:MAG: hypothetical protein G01um101466_141, partial [Parcubacteria group bacterium Gr01-1014_66]